MVEEIRYTLRPTRWQKFWNWIFRRESGTLWTTCKFEGGIVIRNGDVLTVSYLASDKDLTITDMVGKDESGDDIYRFVEDSNS